MVLVLVGLSPEFDFVHNQVLFGTIVPSYDIIHE